MAMKLTTNDLIVWYYDDRNVTGGYVLLDSDDPATIQRVQHALMSTRILCRKQGACFRPAHNKKMYKTFIRVEQASGDSPMLAQIRAAIRTLPDTHYDANPVEIRAYFNRLHETIDKKDDEITTLQHSLQESRNEQCRLIRQFEQEKESLIGHHVVDPASHIDPLGIEQKPIEDSDETYRAMEMYEKELHERDDRICQLEASLQIASHERDQATAQYLDLSDEVRKAQYADQEGLSTLLDEQDEFSQILSALLPNLELVGNSISFMRTEVRDRSQIYTYLYRLNNHEEIPLKAFRGAAGWMEINKKISDGQSHTVRIYCFKKNDPTSRYRVLVSEKSEQERDKERLRKYT